MEPTRAEATASLALAARIWRDRADVHGSLSGVGRTGDVVTAAVDCLVAGVDSPSLRELAGLPAGEARAVVGPVLDATLRELDADQEPPPGTTVGLDGLRALLGLVLDDAGTVGDLGLSVEPGPASWETPHAVRLLFPDGWTTLHLGDEDLSPAEELAIVADRVQEWLVEELPARHRPSNWPACALHPDTHPLEVRVDEGAAVWACPRTGAAQARIGELRVS